MKAPTDNQTYSDAGYVIMCVQMMLSHMRNKYQNSADYKNLS